MTESSASSTKPFPMPRSRGIKAKRKADKQQRVLRDTVLPKVRCSAEESDRIRQLAESANMTLSAYIRTCALKKGRVLVKQRKAIADDALILEVNRIGVNLNQIARALNSGAGVSAEWESVRVDAERVLDHLMGLVAAS